MRMILHILVFLFPLLTLTLTCHASTTITITDFCVANLLLPDTPSGYPCKPLANVTTNDFAFSGFVPFNVATTSASVTNFPGLNGLGISAARVDMGIGGTVPMHTHARATELLIMVQGQMTAGFITPNAVYMETLKPGDLFVFPQGLLHFQYNSGEGNATAFAAYSSPDPGLELLDVLLFGNNLTSQTVSRTTLINVLEVKRLKALFGGTG
ncbi:RmlC-like cupin domain superfamily [Sesbania bispinosa]|nr:RmlC-like cupin domain superfamily [Sesbania bispinosa]